MGARIASSLPSRPFGVVVPFKSGGVLQLADDGMKRGIPVIRRTEEAQSNVRFRGSNRFFYRLGHARLPDARFTRQQHDPGHRPSLACCQRRISRSSSSSRPISGVVVLAACSASKRLSIALGPTTCHACTGSAKPLSVAAPRSRYSNSPPVQAPCVCGDHDGVRGRQTLQAAQPGSAFRRTPLPPEPRRFR